jgi:hypothetical protein
MLWGSTAAGTTVTHLSLFLPQPLQNIFLPRVYPIRLQALVERERARAARMQDFTLEGGRDWNTVPDHLPLRARPLAAIADLIAGNYLWNNSFCTQWELSRPIRLQALVERERARGLRMQGFTRKGRRNWRDWNAVPSHLPLRARPLRATADDIAGSCLWDPKCRQWNSNGRIVDSDYKSTVGQ